jgi:hypothetical protein
MRDLRMRRALVKKIFRGKKRMKLNGPAIVVYSIALLLIQLGCVASGHAQSYGARLGADGLANTRLGPEGCMISYRFLADHSGYLAQVRVYLIPDHTGYAAGTGGTIHVTLNSDDGTSSHHPTSTVLATHLITNILSLPSPSRYFYLVKFSSPPAITAGHLYHLVFKNVDKYPTVNYLSVDDLYHSVPTTPSQPTISDTNLAVLMSAEGGAWKPRPGFTPIYELDFTNGASEGVGYMEGWVGAPRPISGTHAVRETFTVSANVKVSAAAIRVSRIKGNDPLVVRLENANGALVHEGSIPAVDIPVTSAGSPVWAKLPFGATYTLLAGHTYHLDFEATSTSLYEAFPVRKGFKYGFRATTYFPYGYAQFNSNGSWFGWTQWGQTNRTDGDLQFYFTVVP